MNMFALCICYRANWVKIYGYQYYPGDFVLCGWQSDDLPIFAKVDSILVIVGVPLLLVEVFHTVGFNNHILSYSITDSYTSSVISISKLDSKQPLSTHKSIGDANIYIILRYHHFP